MARKTGDDLPWRVQWHVTADGTVIHQRSRGDEPHQQLFTTHATTRPVSVAELDALSEASHREMRRGGLLGYGLVLVPLVVFVVAGGLFTHQVSGEVLPGLVVGAVVGLVAISQVFELVLVLLTKLAPEHGVGAVEKLWLEAGLTSMTGVTMKATEARALIAAPGTTSGVVVRAARA